MPYAWSFTAYVDHFFISYEGAVRQEQLAMSLKILQNPIHYYFTGKTCFGNKFHTKTYFDTRNSSVYPLLVFNHSILYLCSKNISA